MAIILLVAIAALICAVMVTGSWLLGPKKKSPYKSAPYECGVTPVGDANERFPIKFYLVAMLFILFDIEVVFLWSWLTVYRSADPAYMIFTFWGIMIYFALWILGDAYALRVNAFDWDEATSIDPAKLGHASPELGPSTKPQPAQGGQ
jgi:NADH-quinone oxidoreductase subunit A